MELRVYPRLSTGSKRALLRRKGHYGRLYRYSPRKNLLSRLSKELGIPEEGVFELLISERQYLLGLLQTP